MKVAKRTYATIGSVPSQPIVGVHGMKGRGGARAGLELTCTVRVSETFPLAGKLAVVGLNVHAVPVGTFKHWKLTLPVTPLCELRPLVKLADCPTESVVEPGVMLPVKPGACKPKSRVADFLSLFRPRLMARRELGFVSAKCAVIAPFRLKFVQIGAQNARHLQSSKK